MCGGTHPLATQETEIEKIEVQDEPVKLWKSHLNHQTGLKWYHSYNYTYTGDIGQEGGLRSEASLRQNSARTIPKNKVKWNWGQDSSGRVLA
jgi:hypothetical protein